ncbi:hypothetical protein HZ326_30905 [Fusarium oxysporum f. sp. albedinis]|nr:hypothetical protein HZ326_30905 [Fusarium oxysporum f. sp. albedinis]
MPRDQRKRWQKGECSVCRGNVFEEKEVWLSLTVQTDVHVACRVFWAGRVLLYARWQSRGPIGTRLGASPLLHA